MKLIDYIANWLERKQDVPKYVLTFSGPPDIFFEIENTEATRVVFQRNLNNLRLYSYGFKEHSNVEDYFDFQLRKCYMDDVPFNDVNYFYYKGE